MINNDELIVVMMMQDLDKDQNGSVDFEEFVGMMEQMMEGVAEGAELSTLPIDLFPSCRIS